MQVTRSEQAIISAISRGELLKSHRDLDGSKSFRLHQTDGRWQTVNPDVVRRLRAAGLIDSNKKFPVATFWLTDTGRRLVEKHNGR